MKKEEIKKQIDIEKKLRSMLTLSPLVLWGGLLFASPNLISTNKQYNYTVETNYDNDSNYDDKLLKDDEVAKLNTITIFDEYKKYGENYASNYTTYDASNLTEEKLKEVSNKEDFSVTDLLGEPITKGINVKKEITKQDNKKNVVATIYTQSDKYYLARRPKDEIDAQLFALVLIDIAALFGALSTSVIIDTKQEENKKLKLENIKNL